MVKWIELQLIESIVGPSDKKMLQITLYSGKTIYESITDKTHPNMGLYRGYIRPWGQISLIIIGGFSYLGGYIYCHYNVLLWVSASENILCTEVSYIQCPSGKFHSKPSI